MECRKYCLIYGNKSILKVVWLWMTFLFQITEDKIKDLENQTKQTGVKMLLCLLLNIAFWHAKPVLIYVCSVLEIIVLNSRSHVHTKRLFTGTCYSFSVSPKTINRFFQRNWIWSSKLIWVYFCPEHFTISFMHLSI